MYIEYAIIDGKLQVKTTPDGQWQTAEGPMASAVNALLALSAESRLEALRFFCTGCGCVQPRNRWCQCQNDE